MDKKIIITILLGVSSATFTLFATDKNALSRKGENMNVDLSIDMTAHQVKSDEALVIAPKIVNGNDTLPLQTIGVYGKKRYIYYVRNDNGKISGENEMAYRASECPSVLEYEVAIPYCEWMSGSELSIDYKTYGCCNTLLSETSETIDSYEEILPVFTYRQPTNAHAEKVRNLSGSAFIDFPVNQTIIYPEYRNNFMELGKISATIDSVRNDKDVTIREVWLKGYASPESPYSHNTYLAKGRVAALKDHIQNLYKFDKGVITTDFEPEDWEGLRRYVENSNLEHRNEILAMIDAPGDPDQKEAGIKKKYPMEYKFMLQNWYPALRHTDYRIEYTIREFYDPKEIAEVMAKEPSKLSLNEFFVLSNSYEPGSEEFNEVWETAVKLYPNDETANLNAAVNALQRKDLEHAIHYLEKAGDSAEAEYARATYALMKEDFSAAARHLQKAAESGYGDSQKLLEQITKYHNIY